MQKKIFEFCKYMQNCSFRFLPIKNIFKVEISSKWDLKFVFVYVSTHKAWEEIKNTTETTATTKNIYISKFLFSLIVSLIFHTSAVTKTLSALQRN